jgi:hypothetical protein
MPYSLVDYTIFILGGSSSLPQYWYLPNYMIVPEDDSLNIRHWHENPRPQNMNWIGTVEAPECKVIFRRNEYLKVIIFHGVGLT